MTTITASTTVGIDLNPATYTSPVVIDAGVTISNPSYAYAVYRHTGSTTYFAVENRGTITSASTSGIGVYLAPGGAVTNAASGSIAGYTGVKITGGAGTVVNYGTMSGVVLTGEVTNANAAVITGNLLIQGTIDNNGTIAGGGVVLDLGTMINDGTVAGLASVNAATLINNGGITGRFGDEIGVQGYGVTYNPQVGSGPYGAFGGSVTNAASGLPAESYLDTGNRGAFADTAGATIPPNFRAPAATHLSPLRPSR